MVRKSNNTALNNLVDRLNSVLLDNKLESEITFTATTGTVDTHKIVDVTGVVAMQIFAVCETSVVGASGLIEVGTALSTAALIAQTTGTDIDANDIWHDASPDSSIELTSILAQNIITQDVNYKITVAALTAGVIKFFIMWSPISSDGDVTLA